MHVKVPTLDGLTAICCWVFGGGPGGLTDMGTVRRRPPPLSRPRVLAWLKSRGLSQNKLARRLGREPAYVSKVLRGEVISGPIWTEIRRFMRAPISYRRRRRGRPVPRPDAILQALRVLDRASGKKSA